MFLEMHILQNFALSNLNRDDAGAPKSCIFGGSRRARISSQCLKRSVRTHFRTEGLVPAQLLSYRTKWLLRELTTRLVAAGVAQADEVAAKAVELLDLKVKSGKTEYLLMLGERELAKLAAICQEYAPALLAGTAGGGKKAAKKEAGEGPQVAKQLLAAIDGGDAVDVALFGRMIATHAEKNVDAAVQMAHAISTHTVATESDFYSAVDDLPGEEDGAGAGMLGSILYNASCFYRYANVDLAQLRQNLGGDEAHLELAVSAFMEGMVHAVPSGKQTGSAAQNPPTLVLAVVREKGLWSLANAFVKPMKATADADLVTNSAAAMLGHYKDLSGMYDTGAIRYAGLASYLRPDVPEGVTVEPSVRALLDRVMGRIAAGRN